MPKRKPEECISPRLQFPKRMKIETIENGFDEMSQTERGKTHCSCKKTSCLKSYCECFKRGEVCTPECNCQNCKNVSGSEELKKINDEKVRRQSKKFFKSRTGTIDAEDVVQVARINRLRQWLTNDSIRELGVVLLREIQREEHTFEKQYQFMFQESNIANEHHAATPTTPISNHDNQKDALSPETMSLLCDETDAVQAASRPKLATTPSNKNTFRSPTNYVPEHASPEIDRDTELRHVLEKKVLITFKKRMSDILSDIMTED